jgi:hypothetical protein
MMHRRSRKRLILAWLTPIAVTLGLAGAGTTAYAMDGRNPDSRAVSAFGEITAQYWHGLNREPDRAGLDNYLSFANTNCRWGVLDGSFKILNSGEAHRAWRDDPQTLAGMLYAALLNRPGDAGGIATYTAAVRDRGLPWATAAMMGSREYRLRLDRICAGRNETATMMEWHAAQEFAREGFLKKAITAATACGVTTAFKKSLEQLQRTPNPYLMSMGLIAEVAGKMQLLFGLDGTCGTAVANLRAFWEVGKVVDGQRYNPVFIQWTTGSKGLNGQRSFTLRVGADPTHWSGFSGKTW